MGVDFVIAQGCPPKEQFTTEGLLQRVKAADRAKVIREVYAKEKENRPADQMGFEMVYRRADGQQETTLIKISELDALASQLAGWEGHCQTCPANRGRGAFGCIGTVNYPISAQAEVWMLSRLPNIAEPVPYLLLQQGPQMGNTGARAEDLRDQHPGVFFESASPLKREYDEMDVTGEQLFELLFLLGPIPPKRAVMILLFMGAIRRDMDADTLMKLSPAQLAYRERYPFLLEATAADDSSIRELKAFFQALYTAWLLDREVWLDV
jgi:hypothetical protein